MKKVDFIAEIKPVLKKYGFRKKGNYWYRDDETALVCVCVQGSQWNRDDYYVEIGISDYTTVVAPTITQWYCRHRCCGRNGEINITPQELLNSIIDLDSAIKEIGDVDIYLISKNAVKVVNQYWF